MNKDTLTLIKTLLFIITLLALLFWLLPFLSVAAAVLTGGRYFAAEVAVTTIPVIYFGFCFLSCTKLLESRHLRRAGIFFNALILIWAISMWYFFEIRIYLFITMIFLILWSGLLIARLHFERRESH